MDVRVRASGDSPSLYVHRSGEPILPQPLLSESEMKTCPRCKKSKDAEKEFANKCGGKQPFCKLCQSEYQKTYYRANKAAQVARCNKRRDEQVKLNQQKIIDYLLEHQCVDCGETDIVVLQFDHVRGKKRLEIGRMTTFSWPTIEKEIAKCEVRCANDHIRRTAVQQKNYKVLWTRSLTAKVPLS